MIVAVLVAAGLWALLHRTRTGAEMRATVDDRALAGLMGADPVRANRIAWILGTQLAAVGGILIAPELTLDATQLSLLIVSAYTAAVFGRLRSLPLTFVGAVVVGCMESYLTGYLPPNNAFLIGFRLAGLATDPAVRLLDELSMGLAPLVVTRLYEQVAEIARQGVAVLIVEQFAAAVLGIADHAAVLVRGRVERQGRPDSALRAELSALYLGSST